MVVVVVVIVVVLEVVLVVVVVVVAVVVVVVAVAVVVAVVGIVVTRRRSISHRSKGLIPLLLKSELELLRRKFKNLVSKSKCQDLNKNVV